MVRVKATKLIAYGIILCALILFVQAGVSQGKAALAQYLLQSTWQNNVANNTRNPAWPSADGYPAAKLEVPHLNIEQIILSEASMRNLAFAPGFWQSINPNIDVVAGHNDTHFSFINSMSIDDIAILTSFDGNKEVYKVIDVVVVHKTDQRVIESLDKALVLVTCERQYELQTDTEFRKIVIMQNIKV